MSEETEMPPEVAALGRALNFAVKINDKAVALLAPLAQEMKIMNWPAQYRSIMWDAVRLAATEHMEAANEEP